MPLAIALTVFAASAATLLLRPRGDMLQTAAVDPTAYFSKAELDRAAGFRDLQRLIALGALVVSAGVLTYVALRPPRALLARLGRRPIIGAAATGSVLSLGLTVAGLPLSLWAHERAVDVGVVTQSLAGWGADVGRSAAIGALFAAVGGAVAIALARRFPRRWFIPAGGAVAGFAVLLIYLQPIVLDPLFNRFEPLPRGGELRGQVLDLADRSGVDVGEIYRVDASRRTSGINAYVGGLGQTKRVVLYDNLIDDYPRGQVLSVVAHELGHVKHHDIPRGLLWLLIVALPGALLAQRLAETIDRSGELDGRRKPGPGALPAIALSVAVVSFALTAVSNILSRDVERAADVYALRLTDDPRAFIGLNRSLSTRNIGDPDPPGAYQMIFGTHPTTVERIALGRAWGQGRRP